MCVIHGAARSADTQAAPARWPHTREHTVSSAPGFTSISKPDSGAIVRRPESAK